MLGFNQALDTVNIRSGPTWAVSFRLQQICLGVKCIQSPLSETPIGSKNNIEPRSCSPQPVNYLNYSH